MENPSGIYGLTDPRDGQLRYIGMSQSIKFRYYDHCCKGSGERNTPLGTWLKELFSLGLKPGLLIIERKSNKKSFRLGTREVFWIKHFKEQGANLTNINHFQPETRYNQEWYDKYMTSKGLPLRPYKRAV